MADTKSGSVSRGILSLTNGGRSLNAVWKSPNLSAHEKIFMLYLGNQANFNGGFTDFSFHPIREIMQETSLSRSQVLKLAKALEEKKYIIRHKRYVNGEQKPSDYALTELIFSEYLSILEEQIKKQNKRDKKEPSPVSNRDYPPSPIETPPVSNRDPISPIPNSPIPNSPRKEYISPKPCKPPLASQETGETFSPLIEEWIEHAKSKSPSIPVDKKKWGIALEKANAHVGGDSDKLKEILEYVKNDEFWHNKCISPAALLTKNKSGIPKIDNIIASMKVKKPKGRHQAPKGIVYPAWEDF